MNARTLTLPTRPEATLRGLVVDVAHARRVRLDEEGLAEVLAIAADVLRGVDDPDDPETAEQAAEEAVSAFINATPLPLPTDDVA